MIKLFKTAIPLAGMLAVTTVFTGCASVKYSDKLTVSDLFSDAISIIKKNNSLNAEGEVDLLVNMRSSGLSFSVDVTGDTKFEADIKNNVIHSGLDAQIGTLGLSQSLAVENYVVREEEQIMTYTSKTTGDTDDKQWTYSVKDGRGVSFAEFIDKIDLKGDEFKKGLENATTDLSITGDTGTIDNKDCFVVKGILQIDGDTLNNMSSDHETAVMDDKLDIRSVWYFSKDKHELKRAELDLASSVKKINTNAYDIAFEPDKFNVVLDFSYDKNTNISVPDEVRENAKESVDSKNAIELMTNM